MIPRLPVAESDPISIPWARIGCVILLALGLRMVAIERSDVIGTDSYRFLAAAQCIENGDWSGAIADPYHPLTAILIGGVNSVQNAVLPVIEDRTGAGFSLDQRRRERAGWWVSMVAGLLLVWLSIDLTRRLFPTVSPIAVGLLVAVQPYFVRASGDIMSDTIYLACVAFALRAAVVALSGARWSPFATAGLAVGLAYLTRPEGLIIVPFAAGLWVLCRPWPWRTMIPRASLAAVSALALILPYAASIGWRLTGKKDVGELIGVSGQTSSVLQPTGAIAVSGDTSLALASAAEIFKEWLGTAPELVGIAALVGTFALWRERRRDLGVVLYPAIAITMGCVLLRLLIAVREPGYISRRHVFLLVFLSIPFAVRGIEWGSVHFAKILPRAWRPRAGSILLALVIAALVPKAIDAHRADQQTQRWAAEYILAHGGPGQRIYSSREKVGYYAGGVLAPLAPGHAPQLFERLGGEERAWLVFYRERFGERVPELEKMLSDLGTGLVHRASWLEPEHKKPRHLELYLYEKE